MPSLVTEARDEGGYLSGDDARRTRVFDVDAGSEADAYDRLSVEKRVELGAVYEDANGQRPDFNCVCVGLRHIPRIAAPPSGIGLYRIIAEYGYPHEHTGQFQNITGTRTQYIETTFISETPDIDASGTPIENDVQEPVESSIVKYVPSRILVTQWLRTGTDMVSVQAGYFPFEGTINDGLYAGAPRGSLLLHPVQVEQLAFNVQGVKRFRITTRMQYAPPKRLNNGGAMTDYEGWQVVVPHRGFRVKNVFNADGGYLICREEPPNANQEGAPLSRPVNLIPGGGGRAEPGQPAYLKAWHIYAHSNFASIP